MNHALWKEIQKLENLAKKQDKLAADCAAKGEPNFNIHSVQAEQLRQESFKLQKRAS
jgi:hypothetical protein